MSEKKKWTPKEIEMFERAWTYLEKRSPEIDALCEEFNETNRSRNLVTAYWAEKRMWGTLLGTKLASGEKRAQRIIEDAYRAGTSSSIALAVNILTDEEAIIIGQLASRIDKDLNLKVWRVWQNPGQELTELRYSIKPRFEQFK